MKKITFMLLTVLCSFVSYSQLQENFETATIPNVFSPGWLVTDNGIGTGSSWEVVSNPAVVINGLKSAYINRESIVEGYTSEDWLISPATTVPINGELKFTSRQTLAGDNGTLYQVRMSTSTVQSDLSAYTVLGEWTELELNEVYNVSEEKSVLFPTTSFATNVYFAFVRIYTQPTSSIGGDRWVLDDIIVQQACAVPTGVSSTDLVNYSATLSWDAIPGVVNYEIELLPVTLEPTGLPTILTSTNTYVATGLDANLDYKFYIRANCNVESYSSWVGPFYVGTESCPAPNQLWVSNATTTSADLSWTETGAATEWEVLLLSAYNATVPPPPGINPVIGIDDFYMQNLTTTTATVSGLFPATIYYYYVRSICPSGDGASSWSGPYIFSTSTCSAEEKCTYKFYLTNQGSDSWNGGLMQVRQNGIVVATLGYGIMNSTYATQVAICNNVPFDLYWSAAGAAPEQMGVSIEAANGDTVYIKQPGVGTPLTVLYSDFLLGNCEPATCPSPQDFFNSTQSATMADLSWDEVGSATQWEVYVTDAWSPAPLNNATLNTGLPGYYLSNTNTNFIITGLSFPNTLDFYVRAICSSTDFSTWTKIKVVPSDKIELIAFVDVDNDGIKDADEVNFPYGSFTSIQNNVEPTSYLSSSAGTVTIFDNNPTNSYNFGYELDSQFAAFYALAPTAYNAISITELSGTQTFYFPITLIQSYTDVQVAIVNSTDLMPGFTGYQAVKYTNYGLLPASGTISYAIDNPNVTIISVSPSTIVSSASSFTHNYTNLLPGQTQYVNVSLLTATLPTISLGTDVTFSVINTSDVADANTGNDTFSLVKTVVGSYDPNDKNEARGANIEIDQFTQDDYLFYTIRFQNMGTAAAQTVRIEDTLTSDFNLGSFTTVSASHDYVLERVNNKLTWTFNEINLAAEAIDEEGSQGYVFFKVKLNPGFEEGDVIENTAEIYFDFNPAIITNTFQTTFVSTLSNATFDANNLVIYPNPAKDVVQISLQNGTENLSKITIYDIIGKTIKTISVNNLPQVSIPVNDLSTGVYLIEVTTNTNLKLVRKLLVH